MKKSIRVLGIALVAIAALLLPLNGQAACESGVFFGSYYSQILGTTNGPSLRSSFWAMGGGNVLTSAGIDNGPVAETGDWMHPYGSMPIALLSAWGANVNYNGCIETLLQPSSMAYGLSDVDGTGNMVYAVGCATRINTAFTEFDFTNPPGCTSGCAPITLVPAPKALVTATSRQGTQAQITVGSPNFAPGFYGDGTAGCAMNLVIPQYEVFRKEIARNGAAPADHDTSTWVSSGIFNIGTPAIVNTTCASDCDVYVGVLPVYNSGFKTGEPATGAADRLGPNGTKVQAGPILANPPKPRISNPKKTQ